MSYLFLANNSISRTVELDKIIHVQCNNHLAVICFRNDRSMHGFMIIEIIKNKKEQNNK